MPGTPPLSGACALWTGSYRSRSPWYLDLRQEPGCVADDALRQAGREAEGGEQAGVDEVVMPHQPGAGGLDDLDRPPLVPAARGPGGGGQSGAARWPRGPPAP